MIRARIRDSENWSRGDYFQFSKTFSKGHGFHRPKLLLSAYRSLRCRVPSVGIRPLELRQVIAKGEDE